MLLCANLIGGAGCYALEYANRVAFLERRRLAEVTTHDGLTGLLNRAALEEQARTLWQHAQVARLPVSVMLTTTATGTRRAIAACAKSPPRSALQRGRDGWSFHEPSPAPATDLPRGNGGLLKTAS